FHVTGVQTCALPICSAASGSGRYRCVTIINERDSGEARVGSLRQWDSTGDSELLTEVVWGFRPGRCRLVFLGLVLTGYVGIPVPAQAAPHPWAPPPVNECGEVGFDPLDRAPDPSAPPPPPIPVPPQIDIPIP